MALYEDSPVPGAPYLLASVLSFWALLHSFELPAEPEVAIAKYAGAEEGLGLLSDSRDSADGYE